jgi:hypothetical protein
MAGLNLMESERIRIGLTLVLDDDDDDDDDDNNGCSFLFHTM